MAFENSLPYYCGSYCCIRSRFSVVIKGLFALLASRMFLSFILLFFSVSLSATCLLSWSVLALRLSYLRPPTSLVGAPGLGYTRCWITCSRVPPHSCYPQPSYLTLHADPRRIMRRLSHTAQGDLRSPKAPRRTAMSRRYPVILLHEKTFHCLDTICRTHCHNV